MTEVKRRNGYYFNETFDAYFPAASTVLASAGSSYGLEQWKLKQGSQAIMFALRGISNIEALAARLKDPASLGWAYETAMKGLESEGNRVKDFGTDVHSGIEAFLNGKGFSSEIEDVNIAIKTFTDFYQNSSLEVVGLEEEVYSPSLRVAGRFDACFKLNAEAVTALTPYLSKNSAPLLEGFVMADYKTGSVYEAKMTAQLAIYKQGLIETKGIDCASGLIFNIEREKPNKLVIYNFSSEKMQRALEGAKHAIKTWEYFDAPKWYHNQFKTLTAQIEQTGE